jgi:hypothetical protein
LHLRGEETIFTEASLLCRSPEIHKRRIGADILGQLGVPHRSFRERSVVTLLTMLEQEQDPAVLHAISIALSHRRDPRAIEPLIKLQHHPDWEVRFGVAAGLSGYEDEQAIAALLELTRDLHEHVRDWATFGLGTLISSDTEALRAALLARLDDEDEITRGEALLGLARRHDPRVVEPILQDLEQLAEMETDQLALEKAESIGLILEAAEIIADPRLSPFLLAARERLYQPDPLLLPATEHNQQENQSAPLLPLTNEHNQQENQTDPLLLSIYKPYSQENWLSVALDRAITACTPDQSDKSEGAEIL